MKLLFFSMLESKYRGGGEEVAKCLRLSIRVGVKNWKILVHVVYGCPIYLSKKFGAQYIN